MTPEQIVRALAAVEPFQRSDDVYLWCTACQVLMEADDGPDKHKPDCPWRLAVEWVAEREMQLARIAQYKAVADAYLCGQGPPYPPGGTIEG